MGMFRGNVKPGNRETGIGEFMEIILAHNLGFCPGVQRSFELARAALSGNRKVFLLGELVHNREAIGMLEKKGARRIEHPDQAHPGSIVVSRSHGIEKQHLQALFERGVSVVDTTCPRVKKVHNLAGELEKKGFFLVILGNPTHAEVTALISHLVSLPLVVGDDSSRWEKEIEKIPEYTKVAVLEQTTFPRQVFLKFQDFLKGHGIQYEIHDTLCPETGLRQEELDRFLLSGAIQSVVVVGGKHSSNTKALYLMSQNKEIKTHWVEASSEIHPKWFAPHERVLVVSGASTPDFQVNEVKKTLESFDRQNIHQPQKDQTYE